MWVDQHLLQYTSHAGLKLITAKAGSYHQCVSGTCEGLKNTCWVNSLMPSRQARPKQKEASSFFSTGMDLAKARP